MIHPRYLSAVTDGFLEQAGAYPNIALTDFGNQYYGNYSRGGIVDPITANQSVLIPNLKKLAGQKTLALDNPNADRFMYAAYALNVSRESSDYGVSYHIRSLPPIGDERHHGIYDAGCQRQRIVSGDFSAARRWNWGLSRNSR